MNAKDNSGPVSSCRSDQAAGKVSNLCQLRDIGPLYHSLGGYRYLQNDPSSNFGISRASLSIRNNKVGNFTPETFPEWRNQMVNHGIKFGDQQFVDTTSKNLIQLGIVGAQPVLEASSFPDSSHNWKKAAGQGLFTDIYNPILPHAGLDCSMTMDGSKILNASYSDDSHLSEGLPFSTSNQRVATRFVACDGNNLISPVDVKCISSDEVIPSPEQISCITASSDGDLRSDGEIFESGATFSKSSLKCVSYPSTENYVMLHNIDKSAVSSIYRGIPLENNQNIYHLPFYSPMIECGEIQFSNACNSEQLSEMIPGNPNFLSSRLINKSNSSHEDLLQYQLQFLRCQQLSQHHSHMQFNELSEARSWGQTVGNQYDTLGEGSLELPHLPSEQKYEIQQQQSYPVQHAETDKIVDSSNISQHEVLLQYANFKSLPQNAGREEATFMKDLHLRICNDKKCNCNQYHSLISHYDNCHFSGCRVCRPFQEFSSTDTVQLGFRKSRTNLLKALHGRESNVNSSSIAEDVQPPPKRTRIEDELMSENEPTSLVDSLEDQPLTNEESSNSGKSSEDHCNKENPKGINEEHFCAVENPTKTWLTTNNNSGYTQRVKYDNDPVLSEELNNEHKSGLTNNGSACKNRSIGNNRSQVLDSGTLPDLLEQPNCIQEKEESHLISIPGQAESKGDLTKTAADYAPRNALETANILAVSLSDCFTAEQIKEHICSLNPVLGQHLMTEARESTLEVSAGENTCQLCSKDKLALCPPPIYCSCCNFSIKRNLIYYWTLDRMGTKFCFCTRCLKASHGSSISFQGLSFSKAELHKEKNNEESGESWVQCDKCENWQHQICALYNAKKDTDGKEKYICPLCRLQEIKVGEHVALPVAFGAKDLPRTVLSDHIEQRLFKQLKTEREERAKKLGKSFDEVPGAADLVVRVVSSINKLLKVKQQFLNIFPDEDYPAEFPYKSKAILLFQKIEGVDVCLFIMYAQEFGSECGHPNQRSIYISYLDSVKYFRPEIEAVTGEALRTFVYQEILIGYLDFCKKRGFATCYIWACPPYKGEDYIFYCHPETQKIPKKEKLLQWYKSMLRKAVKDDIVLDCSNLYDNFFIPSEDCNIKITAARLPHFDGDYWSMMAEEMIRKMEIESGGESEMNVRKLPTKRTLKAMGHKTLSADAAKDILLMQKLGQTILPVKEDFIIVHLLFTCTSCHDVISGSHWFCNQCKHFHLCSRCLNVEENLNHRKTHTSACGEEHIISEIVVNGIPADTAERDIVIENDIFESRHSFQSFCQGSQYQFETLRRAKHSSMMILYHLHKQLPLTTGRTCSICLKDIMEQARWHCEICPKFDVCPACYYENGEACHNHKLIQLSARSECGVNKYQARQQDTFQIEVILDLLVHSSECYHTKSNPCSYPRCAWLKSVFHHFGSCKIRAARGCQSCKKLWWILLSHSRRCKDSSCRVPRCLDIRKNAEMLSRGSNTQRKGERLF